jgi:hypothetical protein
VLRGRRRRAVYSTVLADAVATQDTVTQLISAIRKVAREVPGAAGQIAKVCTGHDYSKPGKPKIDWDDPAAKDALVSALVNDANALVEALKDAELEESAASALALLASVAGQDVEPAEGSDGRDGRWRIARKVAEDRVISAVDPDARHARKSPEARRDGYRAHVAAAPETGIITDEKLTRASGVENSDPAVADWAATGLCKDYMTWRPNVERAVAQVATSRGRRLKLRYCGVTSNHAWLKRRTAALNLRNLAGKGLTRQGISGVRRDLPNLPRLSIASSPAPRPGPGLDLPAPGRLMVIRPRTAGPEWLLPGEAAPHRPAPAPLWRTSPRLSPARGAESTGP